MRVLGHAAAGFDLGEQDVLLEVELVDALDGTDIHARTILHVDARLGDDRKTRHAQPPTADPEPCSMARRTCSVTSGMMRAISAGPMRAAMPTAPAWPTIADNRVRSARSAQSTIGPLATAS